MSSQRVSRASARRPASLACCVVVLSAGVAAAPGRPEARKASPEEAYKRIFKRLDADGDGAVTRKEYLARTRFKDKVKAAKIFHASDADGDGKVTEVEYVRNRKVTEAAKGIFRWLDATADGRLTKDELRKRTDELFRGLDRDGDGAVTIPEFLRTRAEWAKKGHPAVGLIQ